MMRYYASEEIRQLCIKNNWYTCGTNSDYEYMLTVLVEKGDPSAIMNDIYRHSDNIKRTAPVYDAIVEILNNARAAVAMCDLMCN